MKLLFGSGLENFGDTPCLIGAGRNLSFAELARLADAFIETEGVPPSGLAFLHAYNDIDFVVAYVGALRRGLAVHMLDPTKTEANQRLVDTYRPDVIIDTQDDSPVTVTPSGQTVHPDIAILLSTSGSTGTAKLVKLTHRNIRSNTLAICDYLGMTPTDRGITSLKPFYSYGMSVMNTHLAAGASLVITDLGTDTPEFWDLMAQEAVTNLAGVPFTYELMHRMGTDLGQLPDLRLLTQAGGKLSPDLVRHFARTGQTQGIDFCVMYGQTEAGPRMSYLPPDMALSALGSIGQAIPGGRLYVTDAEGHEITTPNVSGELVYEGPNIMSGYAQTRDDLTDIKTIPALHTGDIAHADAADLFYIDGRSSRLVKPFGLRISLDEVEGVLRETCTTVAVTGTDEKIVLVMEDPIADGSDPVAELAARFGLPRSTFVVVAGRPIPRLSSGKADYKAILAAHAAPPPAASIPRRFVREVISVLLGKGQPPASVLDAFRTVLGARIADRDVSFRTAGGDSLSYMQVFLLLEEYMGDVPDNWAELSIRDLEQHKEANYV